MKNKLDFDNYIQNKAVSLNFLTEAFCIDYENKTVSFCDDTINDMSVNFNSTNTIIDNVNVISIFNRKPGSNNEGNPLIYALNNTNAWVFKNTEKDIINLLNQFIKKNDKNLNIEFDSIITVSSRNILNVRILHLLNTILIAKNYIADYFVRMNIDEVKLDNTYWKEMLAEEKTELLQCFDIMADKQGGWDEAFSFKYIKNVKLRKYIRQSIYSTSDEILKYADIINNKNILVLDDTVASGKTISQMVELISNTFVPQKMTVITLFSEL